MTNKQKIIQYLHYTHWKQN